MKYGSLGGTIHISIHSKIVKIKETFFGKWQFRGALPCKYIYNKFWILRGHFFMKTDSLGGLYIKIHIGKSKVQGDLFLWKMVV